jgi:hypothetical protein
VGVHVDRAGDDVLAGRVDGLVGRQAGTGEVRPDRRDGLAVDEHVGSL